MKAFQHDGRLSTNKIFRCYWSIFSRSISQQARKDPLLEVGGPDSKEAEEIANTDHLWEPSIPSGTSLKNGLCGELVFGSIQLWRSFLKW